MVEEAVAAQRFVRQCSVEPGRLGHPPGSPTAGSDLELLAADTQLLESLPAPFLVVPALPEAFAHLSPNPASADSSARIRCGKELYRKHTENMNKLFSINSTGWFRKID